MDREIVDQQTKLEALDKKLAEEGIQQDDTQEKDKKKGAAKDKKGAVLSDTQQQRQDLAQIQEKTKENKGIFEDKLKKLEGVQQKFQDPKIFDEQYLELTDVSGERKFVKTKLQQKANTFLTDKNQYQLVTVNTEKETVDPFGYDGYIVRTIEQDIKYQEAQANKPKEKDAKKGTKK